jgi:hypothetical protein
MIHPCIVPGCTRAGVITLKLVMRRIDTSAMLTVDTVKICPEHAEGGLDLDIAVRATTSQNLDIQVYGVKGQKESTGQRFVRKIANRANKAGGSDEGESGNLRSRI